MDVLRTFTDVYVKVPTFPSDDGTGGGDDGPGGADNGDDDDGGLQWATEAQLQLAWQWQQQQQQEGAADGGPGRRGGAGGRAPGPQAFDEWENVLPGQSGGGAAAGAPGAAEGGGGGGNGGRGGTCTWVEAAAERGFRPLAEMSAQEVVRHFVRPLTMGTRRSVAELLAGDSGPIGARLRSCMVGGGGGGAAGQLPGPQRPGAHSVEGLEWLHGSVYVAVQGHTVPPGTALPPPPPPPVLPDGAGGGAVVGPATFALSHPDATRFGELVQLAQSHYFASGHAEWGRPMSYFLDALCLNQVRGGGRGGGSTAQGAFLLMPMGGQVWGWASI